MINDQRASDTLHNLKRKKPATRHNLIHRLSTKAIVDRLVGFEKKIADEFEQKKILFPVHLVGGNEKQLVEIFREVKPGDYVLSTHRSHYHYLLAGLVNGFDVRDELERKIRSGKSMSVFDNRFNFLTSAIVAGTPPIATGIAWALKQDGSMNKVWCFIGDGAEDEGHFAEAARYVDGWGLPCTFVIEDNNLSVETPKEERYGKNRMTWPECVRRYHYERTRPHVGTGKFVSF